jgi:hypothetical protein
MQQNSYVGRRFLNPSGTPVLLGLFCFYIPVLVGLFCFYMSLSFYTSSLLTLVRTSVLHPRTRQQILDGGGRGGQACHHN